MILIFSTDTVEPHKKEREENRREGKRREEKRREEKRREEKRREERRREEKRGEEERANSAQNFTARKGDQIRRQSHSSKLGPDVHGSQCKCVEIKWTWPLAKCRLFWVF